MIIMNILENEFDSKGELYFSWWINQLIEARYIESVEYQPEPFSLSGQVNVDRFEPYKKKEGGKYVPEEILAGHIYTADVLIYWTQKAINLFAFPLEGDLRKKKNRSFLQLLCQQDSVGKWFSFIEVKPSFDQNNMTRLAKINQKWVFEKYGIFVNIVIPEKHFEKTFTPTRYFYTDKSGKPRAIKYKNRLL